MNEKFNELTECSICLSPFTDVSSLPCLHLFCHNCLIEWCKTKNLECPICRSPFMADDVQPFCYLRNFMKEIKNVFVEPCGECNQSDAELVECEHCPMKVCKNCKVIHIQKLREEVQTMCEMLEVEMTPFIEMSTVDIAKQISEISEIKKSLNDQLLDVNNDLVCQLYALRQRGIDFMNDTYQYLEDTSDLDKINIKLDEIKHMEQIVSSANRKQDLQKMFSINNQLKELDESVVELCNHLNKKIINSNEDPKQLIINVAYKNIVAQIEETEMLRKIKN